MSVFEWIDIASTLPVEGLEFYAGFLPDDRQKLEQIREILQKKKMKMPMLCCSPDFTDPNEETREFWVKQEKKWIDLTVFFGGKTCRILSGQKRPEVDRKQGVDWVVQCIKTCLNYAKEKRMILAMENHYKDSYWKYPEFAQKLDVFLQIISQIQSKWFGINYDPSNAILAGDDPIMVMNAVKDRIVSMHASDRHLKSGSLEDLKQSDGTLGYSPNLMHGVIGKGLNNYDAIFRILGSIKFDGWISIEDGVNGVDELRESADFLNNKIRQYFEQ
jgi:sugar phosphate isomerase/epimerase